MIVLQFISGVFFVFTELPAWMQEIAAIFPLKWMAQGMRSVFLPDGLPDGRAGRAPGSTAGSRWCWRPGAWSACLVAVRTFRWRNKADG